MALGKKREAQRLLKIVQGGIGRSRIFPPHVAMTANGSWPESMVELWAYGRSTVRRGG